MEGCRECEDEVVVKNRWEVGYMQVDMFDDLTKFSLTGSCLADLQSVNGSRN